MALKKAPILQQLYPRRLWLLILFKRIFPHRHSSPENTPETHLPCVMSLTKLRKAKGSYNPEKLLPLALTASCGNKKCCPLLFVKHMRTAKIYKKFTLNCKDAIMPL